jgi:hypothetical protein
MKKPIYDNDNVGFLDRLVAQSYSKPNLLNASDEDLLAVADEYSSAVDSPVMPIAGTIKRQVLKEIAEGTQKSTPFRTAVLEGVDYVGKFKDKVGEKVGRIIQKADTPEIKGAVKQVENIKLPNETIEQFKPGMSIERFNQLRDNEVAELARQVQEKIIEKDKAAKAVMRLGRQAEKVTNMGAIGTITKK